MEQMMKTREEAKGVLTLLADARNVKRLLLVAVLATTSAAQTLTGRYIAVAGGDTITILTPAKRQVRIRFALHRLPGKTAGLRKAGKAVHELTGVQQASPGPCDRLGPVRTRVGWVL